MQKKHKKRRAQTIEKSPISAIFENLPQYRASPNNWARLYLSLLDNAFLMKSAQYQGQSWAWGCLGFLDGTFLVALICLSLQNPCFSSQIKNGPR